MATVEKADVGMFDDIYAILKKFNNPRLGPEEWRRLFTYAWRDPASAPGFVLMDGPRVVGFIGTIYSQRCINNRMENFCNVTSWIVEPEYRGESIRMVLPLVRMPETTITNFSPSTTVTKIFEQLGFQYLDTHAFIFYPSHRVYRILRRTGVRFITDEAEVREHLTAQQRVLFDHHSAYACTHLLLLDETTGATCYCISTKILRNHLHFNHVQHVSNPGMFIDHAEAIGLRLCMHTGTPLMKVDCRLLGVPRIPGAIRFRVTSPRMFKSERVAAHEVDNLYSELVILNL